ncbi:amidase [Haloprofundus salinisoli]|uniref:amidase n=1 Tax=Haloprofundus salinisoli TaxID=2876193 RepID=UPI001CCF0A5C|nr:amidase [Haloprofundus salinisoli]
MVDEATLFSTVEELGEGLRNGEFTSRELTEAYIERLRTVGDDLNAVVTVTEERALEAADRADEKLSNGGGEDRPLLGVPYGAKDLLAAEGYPTTWGAAPLRDQGFDYDATVVERLDEAGAVLVAKLAMIELAGGFVYDSADATFTGPTANPWNTDAWAGGSSSGPGAAVAAGLVGFAVGSETFGSITTPAAFSGIAGFRPTYGRVSRHGAMALSYTMDKLGPLCRSARGCDLVYRAIAGADERDPSTTERPPAKPPARLRGNVRIAVLSSAGENEQPAVRENYRQSVETFSEFADVEEISLPDIPYASVAGTVIDAESASAFAEFVARGDALDLTNEASRIGGYAQQAVLAEDYITANRVRTIAQRELDETLAPYDAVVVPTRATVASPLGSPFVDYFAEFSSTSMGAASNVAGLPGVSVPNGFGERNLPTAIEIVGRAYDDATVLALAEEYQSRTGHVDYTDLVGEFDTEPMARLATELGVTGD